MTVIKDVSAELGPREVVIGGKVVGKVDNVVVWIGEATEEELAALTETPVILLVKPLPEKINKGGNHENEKHTD